MQNARATQLANGLRAIAIHLPHVHRVVIDAHLKVGPRYETQAQNGISHFLEHMLYRGTPRHPSAHEQALAFEDLGGTLLAATYIDHGSMAIAVPHENWQAALPLFAEVYQQPIYDGLDVEKGIVREEILESLDDTGTEIDADNLVRRVSFGSHALGLPITGTLDHLHGFDVASLSAHHRAHYVGQGTVIAIAGRVDPEEALRSVEKHFASLPSGEIAALEQPAPQAEARFTFVKHSASQTALRVAFRAPGERDALEPATEMLLRLIDDGMSTRLYHRVCDLRGLCYDVSAGYEAYADSGLVDMAAETAHERTLDVLDELLGIATELRDSGPAPGEVEKAIRRCEWQLRDSLDEPGEMAEFFAFGELMGVAKTPEDRYAELRAITSDDVKRAAERVFRRENLSVVAVGGMPKKLREQMAKRVSSFG
jgi:predicted Zn-dependent peptidase